uniref:Uncharacterized protein n=1 Tax=Rhizophora mucronata TaxID=61149 RepID=A0A2P2P3F0_RHIMU
MSGFATPSIVEFTPQVNRFDC